MLEIITKCRFFSEKRQYRADDLGYQASRGSGETQERGSQEETRRNAIRGSESGNNTEGIKFFGELWRKAEIDAIEIGLSIKDFWDLTPREFQKYVKAYERKEKKRVQEIDTMNWLLGQYVASAFNTPKEYPDQPFTYIKQKKMMTGEEMERMARINTIKLGGTIKKINNENRRTPNADHGQYQSV